MISDRWIDYFRSIADATAAMSKDPSTQVGAVVFCPYTKQILSTGYNGVPRGMEDGEPGTRAWERRTRRPDKYLFMEHAERNAIYACAAHGVSTANRAILVTHPPCADCVRAMIQSGIYHVYYVNDDNLPQRWLPSILAGREMLKEIKAEVVTIVDSIAHPVQKGPLG